jgi:hypothetical protein
MMEGRSLRPDDYGRPLDGWDHGDRAGGIAVDVVGATRAAQGLEARFSGQPGGALVDNPSYRPRAAAALEQQGQGGLLQQMARRPPSRPGQRPTNAPPGTLPIDEHPATAGIVHDIKGNLVEDSVGPKSYVGISPAGDVIVTNPDGTAESLGHWGQYAD